MLPLEWLDPLLRSPEPCAAPLRVQLLPAPGKVAAFSASQEGEKGRPPERDCSLPGAVDPVLNRTLGRLALSWHLLQVTGRSAARGRHFAGPPLLTGPQPFCAAPPPPSPGPVPYPLGSPSLSCPFPCLPLWTASPKPSLQSAWGDPSPPVGFLAGPFLFPAVARQAVPLGVPCLASRGVAGFSRLRELRHFPRAGPGAEVGPSS